MLPVLLLCTVSVFCVYSIEAGFRLTTGIPLLGDLVQEEDGSHRIRTFRKSANSLLVYEPIPGAESRYTGVVNRINSHGMRDREYPRRKPPGRFRIIVLGDSVVYGYGVRVRDTMAKILERMLAARSPDKFEVLSFAVPGYSTQQEIELYRIKARHFEPDLVLLGYNLNDEFERSLEIGLFQDRHAPMLQHVYWLDYLLRGGRVWLMGLLDVSVPQYQRRTNVFDDFKQLRRSVDESLAVAVLVFPYFGDGGFGGVQRHQRAQRAAREQGFSVLDFEATVDGYPPESLRVFPDDPEHPNVFANRLFARATFEFLEAEHLIPQHPIQNERRLTR